MAKLRKKNKTEYLQDIVNDYIEAGNPWPVDDLDEVAIWAINQKRWSPPRRSIVKQCRHDLAAAMRLEMEKDPQGRTIRSKHAARFVHMDASGKKKQKVFWFDNKTADPEKMHISLQQRRRGSLGDVIQIKIDQDSFNDNNKYGAKIQLSFNFEKDLQELGLDTEYKPPGPDDQPET